MASLTAINIYLCVNILLIAAVTLLSLLKLANGRMRQPISYRHLLWMGYGLSIAAVLLPLARLSGSRDVMPYTLQVWSAPTMHVARAALTDHRVAMPLASVDTSISLSVAESVAVVLFAAGMLALLIRLALDTFVTTRIVMVAHTLRHHHGVKLLVSDRVRAPFSMWMPGTCIVVVPSALLLRPCELRMAICHEIQHHRQHDTKWLYLYPLLKATFFWNPAAHLLARRIQELQEFACDAAVIARRIGSTNNYCYSLLWIAEQALCSSPRLLSASMIGNSSRKLLKQRVEALLAQPVRRLRSAWVLTMSVSAIALMTVAATSFSAAIQDRRVSLDEATRMAATTPSGGISIPVNDAIVEQLNRLLGTPDGREYLRASLNRMQEHRAMISAKIAEHDLPLDLLAIPVLESGYRNLPQSKDARHGAGLWMFIKPTARNFGLTVNDYRDERLDPKAETDAALRMFAALYSRYNDWGLVLLAYNVGNWRVDKGIRETGSRDVWQLVAQGYENDSDYAARAMATMLILRTPSGLN